MHAIYLAYRLRHSFTTRFLYSCISSSLHHNDVTMDELQAEIVAEGNDLDENGIVDSFLHVCFLFRIPTANDKLFAWSTNRPLCPHFALPACRLSGLSWEGLSPCRHRSQRRCHRLRAAQVKCNTVSMLSLAIYISMKPPLRLSRWQLASTALESAIVAQLKSLESNCTVFKYICDLINRLYQTMFHMFS